jgi:hypothetical protein
MPNLLDRNLGGLSGSTWLTLGIVGVLSAVDAARRGSLAGRWVESSNWDAIGAFTSFQMAWDGYIKSNVPGRSPWSSRSEARADGSAMYDSLVDQIANYYGVSAATVKKEVGGKRDWLAMISEGDW